ncbi:2OG-Fe(II) oxygenase family protein [Pontixanthobacter gangjinensis]|uniref:Prolyl 3,4-dihydroxylase TPA1/OFD1 N-terminal domain-containing protein n=1 Tax=Pontixanthobacter gangjinensis TaxID=1028742 RepID=A0A6I4SKY4_9SPHN|nr:2OG-Fe(II) oxygenase family protein [Pontixanthobacter gangjinensis]MXO56375.1 hypothetical protein [Pontixanthobacter gangjinensis]
MSKKLFEINQDLDRASLAKQFAENKRLQIRDVLTRETAEEIRMILGQQTPWGLAMQAGDKLDPGPQQVLPQELASDAGKRRAQTLANEAYKSVSQGDYGFHYAQYSLVQAYLEKWNEGGPHDLILEYLNTPEFLQLARDVTGIEELIKADGQATLYAAQHFLALHSDSHVAEGWRVAYVLNFALDDWKPDWGGYLNFYDEDGDIVQGFKPRFNALNLFAVPQSHAVSFVPPFAPVGRFAITGWLRDR